MFQFVENQVMKKGQSKVSYVILTNCVVPTQEEETDKMIRNLQISLRNVDVQDWHRVCPSASWLLLSVCVCVPSSPGLYNLKKKKKAQKKRRVAHVINAFKTILSKISPSDPDTNHPLPSLCNSCAPHKCLNPAQKYFSNTIFKVIEQNINTTQRPEVPALQLSCFHCLPYQPFFRSVSQTPRIELHFLEPATL